MQTSLGARHDFLRRFGVPAGWVSTELGALADVIGGGTPSRDESRYWQGGKIPWATPTDLTANDSKYISHTAECITEAGLAESAATLLPVGAVLYTSRATIGAKAIARVPIATNQGFANFVPTSVDGGFLFYMLDLLTPIIKRFGAGTTFDEVSKRDVRKVWCAVPSLPNEQVAIARVLDAVDTALERTRAAIARARDLKTSLLTDAFEQLKAKRSRLGEFISEVRYGTSRKSNERGWGNPTLRIPNIIGDKLSLDDLVYVELPPADIERLTLQNGDLLLVRTNGNPSYVGRSAVFRPPDDRQWIYASYLIRVRLKKALLPEYVNVFLGIERGRRELLRRVTTSAGNHNINSNSIRLLSIPVPASDDEQKHVVEIARMTREHIAVLDRKFTALSELKKSLMHDLLTGRVRVPIEKTSSAADNAFSDKTETTGQLSSLPA